MKNNIWGKRGSGREKKGSGVCVRVGGRSWVVVCTCTRNVFVSVCACCDVLGGGCLPLPHCRLLRYSCA